GARGRAPGGSPDRARPPRRRVPEGPAPAGVRRWPRRMSRPGIAAAGRRWYPRVVVMPQRVPSPAGTVRASGEHASSDAELLAIVLGGPDALALAQAILADAGGLAGLERALNVARGTIRGRRAARVRAALELGRRATAEPLAAGGPLRDA